MVGTSIVAACDFFDHRPMRDTDSTISSLVGTSAVAAYASFALCAVLDADSILLALLVHPSLQHMLLLTFAPCVTQTPPFTAWLMAIFFR